MSLRLRLFLWLLHRNPESMAATELSQYRRQVNESWRKNRWWIDGRLVQLPMVKNHYIENRQGEPIQVRQYKSKNSNGKVLFYLHGGGWVGRNIDTYDNFCRRISRHTKMTVYSIGYRLSPEVKFPGALEDGIDAIRHFINNHNLDVNRLHLCGDSAGGNMAIGITYLLRQEVSFQKLLLLYPPVSTLFNQPSMETYGKGHIIEKEDITWMRDQYLGPDTKSNNPLVSPLYYQDFSFLPTTMVSVGGKDPLYDQVVEFTQKVQSDGQPIEFHQYPDLPHGFYLLHNLSRSVRRAYQDVYKFYR